MLKYLKMRQHSGMLDMFPSKNLIKLGFSNTGKTR